MFCRNRLVHWQAYGNVSVGSCFQLFWLCSAAFQICIEMSLFVVGNGDQLISVNFNRNQLFAFSLIDVTRTDDTSFIDMNIFVQDAGWQGLQSNSSREASSFSNFRCDNIQSCECVVSIECQWLNFTKLSHFIMIMGELRVLYIALICLHWFVNIAFVCFVLTCLHRFVYIASYIE